MTDATERSRGYFSLLRWRPDPFRDEARNVAVVLVDEVGNFGGLRAAPISSISKQVHEQGLLDGVIDSIASRFDETATPTLGILSEWRTMLTGSLVLTEPKPASVGVPEETLEDLYKALVRPMYSPSEPHSKGRILDKVVDRIRRRHAQIRRGQYVNDFLFDAVIDSDTPKVIGVLSFANRAKSMKVTEHDAAHFLFACERVTVEPRLLLQRPLDNSSGEARASYSRVSEWLSQAEVEVFDAEDMKELVDSVT
jgi:hypothetical protein